jgi:hypothetical protein
MNAKNSFVTTAHATVAQRLRTYLDGSWALVLPEGHARTVTEQ